MKNIILRALLVTMFLGALHAESPVDLNEMTFLATITSGSGVFGKLGQYQFLPEREGSRYWISALNGDVVDSKGTFVYTKTGADTAKLETMDSSISLKLTQTLVFTSPTTGTFQLTSSFGSQSGTFEGEYRYRANDIGHLKPEGLLIHPNADGTVTLSFKVHQSSDLLHWSPLVGIPQIVGDAIQLTTTPEAVAKLYRLVIQE